MSIEKWSVTRAVEILRQPRGQGGPAAHILGHHENDRVMCNEWMRHLKNRMEAHQPYRIVPVDENEGTMLLADGDDGDIAWEEAERTCSEEDTRIVVMIEAGDWESIIGNDDEQMVSRLRKRLSEAKRIHIVACRAGNEARQRHAETRLENIFERCWIRRKKDAWERLRTPR